MPDTFYTINLDTLTRSQAFTDDGTGTDWLIITGARYEALAATFRVLIRLDAAINGTTPAAELSWMPPQAGDPSGWQTVTYTVAGTIENVIGGASNEDIWGNDAANMLQGDDIYLAGGVDQLLGRGGHDTLIGAGGGDYLFGGDGNDRLYGDWDRWSQDPGNYSAGDDYVYGGAGDDSVYADTGTNLLDGGADSDLIDYSGFYDTPDVTYRATIDLAGQTATVWMTDLYDGGTYVVAQDIVRNFEHVIGTGGSDLIIGTSSFAPGQAPYGSVYGLAGDDEIRGGSYSDTLYGGAGNDTLSDGGQMQAGGLRDYLDGGIGDDLYIVTTAPTYVQEYAENGRDTVHLGAQIAYTLHANVEDLRLLSSAGAAEGIGNTLANAITGNAFANRLSGGNGKDSLDGGGGNDTLNGGLGHDRLSGQAGADLLNGGEGNDSLTGGAGNDTLIGGAGRDVLAGGADADVFQFVALADLGMGAARDVIRDHDSGIDRINLSRLMPGQTYLDEGRFTGKAGEVRYVQASGILMGDSDGDRLADWQISLGAGTELAAGDLIL